MVTISEYIVYRFIFAAVIVWIFFSIGLIITHWFLRRKNVQFPWGEIKLWPVLLILTISVALFFLCWSYFLKKSSERQISQMIKCLDSSDRLQVTFTYLDPNGKYIEPEVQINDKLRIIGLLNLLKNRSYMLISSDGALATSDWIEVCAYKNGKLSCKFCVLALDLLHVIGKSHFSRFECSDEDLTFSVRRELGLPELKFEH